MQDDKNSSTHLTPASVDALSGGKLTEVNAVRERMANLLNERKQNGLSEQLDEEYADLIKQETLLVESLRDLVELEEQKGSLVENLKEANDNGRQESGGVKLQNREIKEAEAESSKEAELKHPTTASIAPLQEHSDKFTPNLQKASEYLSQFQDLAVVEEILNLMAQEEKIKQYDLALMPQESEPFEKMGHIYLQHLIQYPHDSDGKRSKRLEMHSIRCVVKLSNEQKKEGQISLEALGLEPEQIKPLKPTGLVVLKEKRDKIAAILLDKELREKLGFLTQFAKDRQGLSEAQHYTQLALTARNPINQADFVTLCDIEPGYLINTSSGHQFDIHSLLETHRHRIEPVPPGSDLDPSFGLEFPESKSIKRNPIYYLLNPYTNKPFNSQDVAYIKAFARAREVPLKTIEAIAEIQPEFLVCTIDGFEFDIRVLIQHHNNRGWRSLLDPENNKKYLVNPFTREPFHSKDVELIKRFAQEKNIHIVDLSNRNFEEDKREAKRNELYEAEILLPDPIIPLAPLHGPAQHVGFFSGDSGSLNKFGVASIVGGMMGVLAFGLVDWLDPELMIYSSKGVKNNNMAEFGMAICGGIALVAVILLIGAYAKYRSELELRENEEIGGMVLAIRAIGL